MQVGRSREVPVRAERVAGPRRSRATAPRRKRSRRSRARALAAGRRLARPPARARAPRSDGSRPRRSPRQRRQRARRRAAPRAGAAPSQARWNGEKTVYGLPACVRSAPTSSTREQPGVRVQLRRPRRAAPRARARRARARTALTSRAEVTRVGADLARPARRARARAAPWRTTSPLPRSRSEPVEVRQALEQELRARAGGVAAVQQAVVEAEDRHDAARPASSAARSAGWSCTRRSRRNQTSAVIRAGAAPPRTVIEDPQREPVALEPVSTLSHDYRARSSATGAATRRSSPGRRRSGSGSGAATVVPELAGALQRLRRAEPDDRVGAVLGSRMIGRATPGTPAVNCAQPSRCRPTRGASSARRSPVAAAPPKPR